MMVNVSSRPPGRIVEGRKRATVAFGKDCQRANLGPFPYNCCWLVDHGRLVTFTTSVPRTVFSGTHRVTRSSSHPDSNPPSEDSGTSKDAADKSKAVTRGPEAETQEMPGPVAGGSPLTGLDASAENLAGSTRRDLPADPPTKGRRLDETLAQDSTPSAGDFSVDDASADVARTELGRYRIESLLGRGGMGSVYLAHDSQLDRKVALKVPKFESNANPRLVERFYREARSAANLSHPNLCPVFDVGEVDGTHYIAMALIKGQPLSSYVNTEKALPERSVAGIVRKVALAMQEAHSSGIIHRDLKPANIMIDHRKEPIVMDFGLACPEDLGDDSRLTQDGALLGSPAYMSPEQLRGHQDAIGPCSDVYSLGVVLYELLSGRLPFGGTGSTVAMIGQILTETAPGLETLRADLDPRLVSICAKAMEKKVQDRYPSMDEFASDLGRFLQGRSDVRASAQATKALKADVTRIQLNEHVKLAKTLCESGQFAAAAPILEQIVANPNAEETKAKAWATSTLSKVNAKIEQEKRNEPAVASTADPFADLPDALASPASHLQTTTPRKPRSAGASKNPGAGNVSKPIAIFAGLAFACVLVGVGAITWMINSGDEQTTVINASGLGSSVDGATAAASERGSSTGASGNSVSGVPPNDSSIDNRSTGFAAGAGIPRRPDFAERLLARFDRNRDGVIDSTEVPEHERARMFEADQNRDNQLALEELRTLDPLNWPPGNFGDRRGPPPQRPGQFEPDGRDGARGNQGQFYDGRRPGNRTRNGGRGNTGEGLENRRGPMRGGGASRNGEGTFGNEIGGPGRQGSPVPN